MTPMSKASTCSQVLASGSLVDWGWYWLTWHSKKNSNSTQFVELDSQVSEQIKPLQPLAIGQAAEFKFESKFEPEPLPIIWQSLPKAIPEDIKGFDCKINGQALGAALRYSLGWSEGLA